MKILRISSFLILSLWLGACKNKDENSGPTNKKEVSFFKTDPEEVPELASNRLSNEPSDFLRLHANSEIKWQPWTSDVLDYAARSQRLILIFVGASTYPESHNLAKLLEEKFKKEINEEYVPVMADSSVDPSLALACHLLASERGEPIAFPYLLWLSHEGNPVAWIPVTSNDEESLLLGFRRAQNTVRTIRDKSPRYVVENSRYDNEGRLARIAANWELTDEGKKLHPDQAGLFLKTQALADLYDHVDRTFDSTGGIPPGNLITSLARISQHPASPRRLRENASIATKESLELLSKSALRDPTDGYFFSRRNSRSFAVPALTKNLNTQAEMLSAIASSSKTPASELALEQLLASLSTNMLRNQSLLSNDTSELAFFWSTDSIEDILSPEEFKVAKAAFNLRNLGNVPSADDPQRLYFRRNTLGLARFGQELAETTGLTEPAAGKLLSSAIEKIAIRRKEILGTSEFLHEESMSVLSPLARLLTALARAQGNQPNTKTEQLLEQIGTQILTDFSTPDGDLLRIATEENRRNIPAQGYDYAVTIEALLEWYRVSWKPELLQEIKDLATVFLENFITEEGYPIEVPVSGQTLTFPIHNHTMIFGPSTWGTSYGILKKLSAFGIESDNLEPCLQAITPLLELGLKKVPVVHSDYLLAAANNVENYVLVLSKNEQENQTLREELAQARYDSVISIVENTAFPTLPSPKDNAAILLKEGEQVAIYQTADTIADSLQEELAK